MKAKKKKIASAKTEYCIEPVKDIKKPNRNIPKTIDQCRASQTINIFEVFRGHSQAMVLAMARELARAPALEPAPRRRHPCRHWRQRRRLRQRQRWCWP